MLKIGLNKSIFAIIIFGDFANLYRQFFKNFNKIAVLFILILKIIKSFNLFIFKKEITYYQPLKSKIIIVWLVHLVVIVKN